MNSTSATIEYEARTETICRRYGKNREFLVRDTYTVYVPVGTPDYSIPARQESKLDLSKLAEAQAWADHMRDEMAR